MQRWWVAAAGAPSRPLVEVTFRRPWRLLGLVPRVSIRACAPEGEPWVAAVELALDVDRVRAPRSGAWLEPPHTRSASRLDLALTTLSARAPALVGYRADADAPPPAATMVATTAAASPAPASGDADRSRELLARLGRALSSAEARGWGGPDLDRFAWLLRTQRAGSVDELSRVLGELAEEAATRPGLRTALDALGADLDQPWAEGDFGRRVRAALGLADDPRPAR